MCVSVAREPDRKSRHGERASCHRRRAPPCRARSRTDRRFHDRYGVPATPCQPSALSHLGQWRGGGTVCTLRNLTAPEPYSERHARAPIQSATVANN
jgi:hypothetical protein